MTTTITDNEPVWQFSNSELFNVGSRITGHNFNYHANLHCFQKKVLLSLHAEQFDIVSHLNKD